MLLVSMESRVINIVYSWEINDYLDRTDFKLENYYELEKIRLSSPQVNKIELIDDVGEYTKIKVSTTDDYYWNISIKKKIKF